jgi:hypothetical protein
MTDAPIIATVDDIDRGFASRAFNGTSFDPERRGQSRREEYANTVNGFYAELWPLATTEEQKTLLATEMERYRQGYLERMKAYLASHSSLASPMIAGPSNFPVRRMDKLNRWTDKKVDDLIEWNKRAREAVKRKLLDARPEEEKAEHAWRVVESDLAGSLSAIREIDEEGSPYTRALFVSSLTGKVERLAANGETELVAKALQLVRDYNASHKKPAISDRHRFWELGSAADLKAQRVEQAQSAEPEVIAEREGVKVVTDPAADRVRIVFAAKPDVEIIGRLKSEAWKWSPSNGAWQRKLTEAAKSSACRITGLTR